MSDRHAWRLARRPHADLSGEGARRYGGRWNAPGRPALYLSEEAALPLLEVLVNLDLTPDLIPDDYVLMCVELAGLEVEDGPQETSSFADSRRFGEEWLAEARTPLLRVPSVIVPESRNLVLNPRHPQATRLPAPTLRPFTFDPRLFEFG